MVLFYMLEIIAVIMIFYAATLLLNVEWDFCQERNGKDSLSIPLDAFYQLPVLDRKNIKLDLLL